MLDLNREQLAREKIDAMLVAAGWIVQDCNLQRAPTVPLPLTGIFFGKSMNQL